MSQNMRLGKSAVVRWEWLGEAGKLWTSNPAAWIGMSAITTVGLALFLLPVVFIFIRAGISASNNDPGAALATAGVALLMVPVLLIIMFVVGTFFASGMYRAAIRQAQGEPISVGSLLSGGNFFPRILGLTILMAIVQIIVALIIRIPGLVIRELDPLLALLGNLTTPIIYGVTLFSIPLIVDRGLGVFDAIGASIEATKKQWWMFALFSFVLYIVSGIGVVLCGIGIIATLPFYFITPAVAYRDTFGLPGGQGYDRFQAPPPPDYRTYASPQASATQGPPYFESSHQPNPAPRPEQPYRPEPAPRPEPPYRSAPPQPEQPYRPSPPAQEPPYRPAPPPQPEPTYRPAPPPQPPNLESQTRTCPHCGATLNRVANFCNQCGNRLNNV
jgi:uncharacterized membrane protein